MVSPSLPPVPTSRALPEPVKAPDPQLLRSYAAFTALSVAAFVVDVPLVLELNWTIPFTVVEASVRRALLRVPLEILSAFRLVRPEPSPDTLVTLILAGKRALLRVPLEILSAFR